MIEVAASVIYRVCVVMMQKYCRYSEGDDNHIRGYDQELSGSVDVGFEIGPDGGSS